jgi:GTP-sensing pleiotropic transcriptional regulator CodY
MDKSKGDGMKDNQFLVIGYNLLDSKEYRNIMTKRKGMEMTYQWLRRHIVRAPMRNIYGNEVYKEYFLNGSLAASIGEEQLAQDLGISRSCVRDNLKDLDEAGLIKIKELTSKTRMGSAQKKQKVYILGKWVTETDLNGHERYAEFMLAFDLINKPFS